MTVRVLGIESSCDETAAAIVADGVKILSSVVASQIDVHRKYGGVVPELASREHLRQIVPVVREAVLQANLGLQDVDAIGVTQGPGLVGSLLVGLTYGKVLAQALGKPLIAVNHLEGHVHAVFLEAYSAGRVPKLPAMCLIVSGGHTLLYRVEQSSGRSNGNGERRFSYTRIGSTRDDAAGEAYDKVAKMLALGYPGGPVIDKLAPYGNPNAIRFGRTKIRGNPFDFSFSGIKTAVLYHLRSQPELQPEIAAREAALANGQRGAEALRALSTAATLDLIASFQDSVVEDLLKRTLAAAEQFASNSVLVSGGVAANSQLRRRFEEEASKRGFEVFFPSRPLSTDNAAMIAAAAFGKFAAGERADATLNAAPNFPLGVPLATTSDLRSAQEAGQSKR
ncbi:MAG TPA: tRNA (adenosine(37)-N6)-threonylcarbamoyltransferase complex transferase subunit TsaD [Verrucomicrobiae bacterium]|nr:tRNA (adenosine(37)-N6)-threonylcarbamoyltransferase complex transferase subunit TsaD [Verrucomicrobiae bacterium]